MNFVYTAELQALNCFLIKHGAGFNQHFTGLLVYHVANQNPTQHSLTQSSNDVAALNDRTHNQTFLGATVFFGYHQILGDIYQPACQVTRVGCLQSGIRQTFTRTVC